jgi:hypothetical protein
MYKNEDSRATTHKENRGQICNSVDCHPGASKKFGNYQVHAEFNKEKSPVIYWFTTFFIILTGGTLLPLMAILFLDLLRRLFPNASFRRRKEKQ